MSVHMWHYNLHTSMLIHALVILHDQNFLHLAYAIALHMCM